MRISRYNKAIDDEVAAALPILKRGGLILYPTDTVWGIGCDATNAEAIDKVYALKQRAESKSLICLVNDFNMLNYHVQAIPEMAYNILKYATKPTTIIYDKPIRVPENLVAKDDTLGIRLTQDDFCGALIKKLGKPLVSTSANVSGEATPKSFKEISPAILAGVDYIVNLQRNKKSASPSAIIRLSGDGKVQVLRQ